MLYRYKLTNFTVGEKNRTQNCLTVSNIKLDDVFSDVFGKTASALTDKPLETSEPFDVKPFLKKNLKHSPDEIQKAVNGSICAEQAEKLRIIRTHMDNLKLFKANLESTILSLAEKYSHQLEIISSVPGIDTFSAITIIFEIGVDMSVFSTDKQLCSWTRATAFTNLLY